MEEWKFQTAMCVFIAIVLSVFAGYYAAIDVVAGYVSWTLVLFFYVLAVGYSTIWKRQGGRLIGA